MNPGAALDMDHRSQLNQDVTVDCNKNIVWKPKKVWGPVPTRNHTLQKRIRSRTKSCSELKPYGFFKKNSKTPLRKRSMDAFVCGRTLNDKYICFTLEQYDDSS